jgi:DNA-binding transcriptional ArsR family regulator
VIELHLTSAAFGGVRFGFSPLGEAARSVVTLAQGDPRHHAPWRAWAWPRLDRVDLGLLLSMLPAGRWFPDLLSPAVVGTDVALEDQLEELARVEAEDAREQLVDTWDGRPLPDVLLVALSEPGFGARVADEIDRYWRLAVEPHWDRVRGTLELDVSSRVHRMLAEGVPAMFADMHPEVRMAGEVLRVDKPAHDEVRASAERLTLVPSVFARPRLSLAYTPPATFEIVYPVAGADEVWDHLATGPTGADGLGVLLGRTRAGVLGLLAVPMSTTALARRLGQSPATISEHLAVLRDCELVRSWRSGRQVLYVRTALGASLAGTAAPQGSTAAGA